MAAGWQSGCHRYLTGYRRNVACDAFPAAELPTSFGTDIGHGDGSEGDSPEQGVSQLPDLRSTPTTPVSENAKELSLGLLQAEEVGSLGTFSLDSGYGVELTDSDGLGYDLTRQRR